MGYLRNKPSTNLLENVKLTAELFDAYEALSKDKNFITLIEKGLFETFGRNQIGMLAHPEVAMNKNNDKEMLHNNLLGISVLENFFITLERLGPQAKEALAKKDRELDDETEEVTELGEE